MQAKAVIQPMVVVTIAWTKAKRASVLPERGGPQASPQWIALGDITTTAQAEKQMRISPKDVQSLKRGIAKSALAARAGMKKLAALGTHFPSAKAKLDVEAEAIRRTLGGGYCETAWWCLRNGPSFALRALCAALRFDDTTTYNDDATTIIERRGYDAECGALSSNTIELEGLRALFASASLSDAEYGRAEADATKLFHANGTSTGAKIAIAFAFPSHPQLGDAAAREVLKARARIKSHDVEYPCDVRLVLASVRSPELAAKVAALGSDHLHDESTILTLLHRLGDSAAKATFACVDSLVTKKHQDWTQIKMLARAHFMIETKEAFALGAKWRANKKLAPIVEKAFARHPDLKA